MVLLYIGIPGPRSAWQGSPALRPLRSSGRSGDAPASGARLSGQNITPDLTKMNIPWENATENPR